MDKERGGKTTLGNGQAWSSASPRGQGEQEKMEKTGCKIICGAPTTLTVKGLMMMMKVSLVGSPGLFSLCKPGVGQNTAFHAYAAASPTQSLLPVLSSWTSGVF